MKYAPSRITWPESRKNRVTEVLQAFRNSYGDYPTTKQLEELSKKYKKIIPSVRWIQNNGGIAEFYNTYLGLKYLDARTGSRRARIALQANRNSMSTETEFSKKLIETFGESNVHFQSPYNKNGETLHRSDFKVYRNDGSVFFVDLFFPGDIHSFKGCVNIKLNKLKDVKVEHNAKVYMISCNTESTSPFLVDEYVKSRKNKLPANIKIIHIDEITDVLKL